MSERPDSPIGPDEVEAFYARQRDQILSRLDEKAPAGRVVRFPARTWVGLGLAAAAALVLTFVAFQRPQSPEPEAGDLVTGSLPYDVTSVPAGLEAFGAWTGQETDEELATDLGPEAEMDSLTWLLADETGSAQSVPAFLEPFGTWETAEAET